MMYRIMRADGTSYQSRAMQVALVLSYFCFSATGLLFLLSPKLHDLWGHSGQWMAWFIHFGALLSLIGCITRRWMGEFVGSPLLGTGFVVLGIESWVVLRAEYPYFSVSLAGLMIGTAFLVVGRWRRILAVYHFVHDVARMGDVVSGRDE